jgi:ABC-2 type transport system permease protein
MHKIWVIACREYLAAVRSKAFLVSLVFMPVLMVGSVGVQVLVDKVAGNAPQRFAVIDRTPGQEIFPALKAAAERRNQTEILDPETKKQKQSEFLLELVPPSAADPEAVQAQRYELSERVRQGSLTGVLDIGADVARMPDGPLDPTKTAPDRLAVRYQSNNPAQDSFGRWADRVINEVVVARRCQEAGVKPQLLAALVQHVPLRVGGLVRRNAASGAVEDTTDEGRAAVFLVPAALTLLMFMVIMVGATPLMQGVIEEKMQRIAEVLLGSVSPFELMMGKLMGMMGVSLTLAAVYLGGAYWAAGHFGYTELLPARLLIWFVVFQTLAVVMYGSLFIAIGAAVTDPKESQTLLLPVVLIITLPMLTMRHVITEPNGGFAFWASLFPFSTPMLMVTRMGLSQAVPWWQPLLGVVLVLAATFLCVYAAGRIFRVGILMQGKGAKMSDLARWVFRG